jgi:uncharacterized membrane protein YkgB
VGSGHQPGRTCRCTRWRRAATFAYRDSEIHYGRDRRLKPLITGTPWLAWLYPVFGEAGASYLLGVVEILAALLLAASPWSARAGIAGGALGVVTFFTTSSLLIALPIWEAASGGFPWLNGLGSFLVKDIALLGIALVVLGESLGRATR